MLAIIACGAHRSLTRTCYDLAMVTAIAIFTGIGAFVGLCCGLRAYVMFNTWRPAAATLWASDYGEAERRADRFRALWDDEDTSRLTKMTVMFEDEAGTRRRAEVSALVPRGTMPDGSFVVWYDPDDPDHVTRDGPLWWLICTATAWAGAILLLRTAM